MTSPTSSELVTALGIAALAAAINALRSATSARSTDHDVHVTFVGLIRRNRHRFLRERTNHLYGAEMAYPQLLHWLLSFLPENAVARFGRYTSSLFAFVSAFCFCGFVWLQGPALQRELGIGASALLWPAALLFALTPYTYDARDAKNRGLSARGFGLLLGQLYVYACISLLLDGGIAAFGLAVGCCFAILLGSQFTAQFVVFFTPLLALWARDPIPLLAPVCAFGLWFATMPGIAREEVRGQLRKKRLAAGSPESRSFLRSRHSVWRDFALDFWRPIPRLWARRDARRWRRHVEYVYYNPFVRLVTGFPSAVVLLGLGWRADGGALMGALLGCVSAALAVCVATSFRATRFLGTPERYMESAAGPAALGAAVALHGDPAALAGLGIACAALIAWEFGFFGRIVRERRLLEPAHDTSLEGALARLDRELDREGRELRLLSNNRLLTKRFMTPDRVVFLGTATDRIGRFRYAELYDHEDHLRPERIADVIREFRINVVLLDGKREGADAKLFDHPDLDARLVCRAGHVELWTVARRGAATTGVAVS